MLKLQNRIVGIERLQARLDSDEMKNKIEAFLDKWADKILKRAVHVCPHDTGRLRNSIDVMKPSRFTRNIGTSVEYAPYVEFGTAHITGKVPTDPRSPVRLKSGGYSPYLRLGFEQCRPLMKAELHQLLAMGTKKRE